MVHVDIASAMPQLSYLDQSDSEEDEPAAIPKPADAIHAATAAAAGSSAAAAGSSKSGGNHGEKWHPEEEEALAEVVAAWPTGLRSWEHIAEELGTGRTANACQMKYYTMGRRTVNTDHGRRAPATSPPPPPPSLPLTLRARREAEMRALLEAEMRALLGELTLPEGTASRAIACCSRLVEAASLHDTHCTTTKCRLKSGFFKVAHGGYVSNPQREACMAGCVLVYTLRQHGPSLTFREVLGALNASMPARGRPATLKINDMNCFDMVSRLLTGLYERQFACCGALPATTDTLSTDAPTDTEVPPAHDSQRSEAPAPGNAPSTRREQCMGLLQRCCRELEWGPGPTDVAVQLLAACSAHIFDGDHCQMPQGIVGSCIMAVHHRHGARLLPCLDDGNPAPLRPVCGINFSPCLWATISKYLGSSWSWALDCVVDPLTQVDGRFLPPPINRQARVPTVDSFLHPSVEPPAKRQATGSRQLPQSGNSSSSPRATAVAAAAAPPVTAAAAAAAAPSAAAAVVARRERLHTSLLQRQRTDEAQRAAGMPGMSSAEREQLRTTVATLAAKLAQ